MARRQTPKQRAASLRNLKKARAARGGRRRSVRRVRRPVIRRRTPRRVVGGAPRRSKKIGAILRGARAIDNLTGPAQGAIAGGNFKLALARYTGQFGGGTTDDVITTVKGVGTGLVRTAITSKSGAYRGMSQKKILSFVQALSPEIVALRNANPMEDIKAYNQWRHIANEAYDPASHDYVPGNDTFRDSLILQGSAWVAQKVAVALGVNKMLPKGVNL